jgi:hypothetical protein
MLYTRFVGFRETLVLAKIHEDHKDDRYEANLLDAFETIRYNALTCVFGQYMTRNVSR